MAPAGQVHEVDGILDALHYLWPCLKSHEPVRLLIIMLGTIRQGGVAPAGQVHEVDGIELRTRLVGVQEVAARLLRHPFEVGGPAGSDRRRGLRRPL